MAAALSTALHGLGPGSPGDTLQLRLAARRDALEPARLAVLRFLAPTAPSAKLTYSVELVLEEVLMNIVWHAFPEGSDATMDLRVELLPEAVVLTFEDDGKPFNPLSTAAPEAALSIEQATPGGLGIALVRQAARELAYQRLPQGNQFRVTLARSA